MTSIPNQNAKGATVAPRHSHLGPGQVGIHERLRETVLRHLESRWKRPIADHNRRVFEQVHERLDKLKGPLILDSGCGTGESTRRLARRFPGSFCIGIDRSLKRLGRWGIDQRQSLALHADFLLVRGDCEDWWRLIADAGWNIDQHYLLYPNPYPKASQLKRRWHGHPVFPDLLRLGGQLEMRTNSKVYADEFQVALAVAGWNARQMTEIVSDDLTPFELKYRRGGEVLFRVCGCAGE